VFLLCLWPLKHESRRPLAAGLTSHSHASQTRATSCSMAGGHGQLVDDFYTTIEEAGLSDLANEIGIQLGPGSAITLGSNSQQLQESEEPQSFLGAASPARVHVPHCSSSGPSVPAELAATLSAAGDPGSKKKRVQRAHGGKQGDKGLRHFSMKVCEKVEQKGRTTYNEVADELVAEFAVAAQEGTSPLDQAYDEKNIRRRVYDALNVLMAMEIITKEKKNILWRGLPSNTEQEHARLQMDLNSRDERMQRKRLHLQDLVQQQISFKQLIARNIEIANSGRPMPATDSQIALPFIVVNTKKETVVDCEMAEDKQEIFFNFSAPFEIHDDSETLKRMHMQRCPSERLAALVPPNLVQFARGLDVVTDAPATTAGARSASGRR